MRSLRNLGLLDAPPESGFDNLTALAAQMLQAPVSLLSILDFDGDRQFFKCQFGLDAEPWATDRQSPLSHSFCQYVVKSNAALVVNDAPEHPLVKDNQAIVDLGVRAYLGLPVYTPDGSPVGALCVIDVEARNWTKDDVAIIERLASCVTDVIHLSIARNNNDLFEKELKQHTYALLEELNITADKNRKCAG